MKKKTQILLVSLWGLALAGSRVLYFLLRKQSVADTYEYFANAMIWAEKSDMPLDSGLAHAYTEKLFHLLRFTGSRIEAVCTYQMVLQILWIIFLFLGIRMLFGKLAGIVTSTIMAGLPMVLSSIMIISTENFYMLHLTINLLLLGVFYRKTQKAGWYRSSLCELYLMMMGFYMGVICIWNYVGWCLIAVMIYVLIQNHLALRDKILAQKYEEERELREQIMGAGSQALILFAGIAAGMYATLMKYTGLTGQTIVEQFTWWKFQLSAFPGRCQDISIWLILTLVCAVFAGIFLEQFVNVIRGRKMKKNTEDTETKMEKSEMEKSKTQKPQMAVKEKQEEYVTTEDGRRIKLLDNPLPTPKKHVKKEMDFDVEVNENDDFDI